MSVGNWEHSVQIRSVASESALGLICLDMIVRDNGPELPMDLRGPFASREAAEAEATRLNQAHG